MVDRIDREREVGDTGFYIIYSLHLYPKTSVNDTAKDAGVFST